MSQRSDQAACGRVEALLEAFVDAELRGDDRSLVEDHVAGCAECRRQHELAVRIRTELRGLPEMDAPPVVIEQVLEEARREQGERPSPWWRMWRPSPVWALAVAVLAIAVLLPLVRQPSAPPTAAADFDAATIQRAAEEARFALGYLSRASRRTGLEIRDGLIVERLMMPAAERLRSISRRHREEGLPSDET